MKHSSERIGGTGTRTIRFCAFVALMLALTALSGWGVDRSGTFDASCEYYNFHVRASNKTAPGEAGKEIVISLYRMGAFAPLGQMSAVEWQIKGKLWRAGSETCEEATKASLRLASVSKNGKHASGSFTMDFADGRHEEGQFEAKFRHEGARIECE